MTDSSEICLFFFIVFLFYCIRVVCLSVGPVISRQGVDTHPTVTVNNTSVLNCAVSGHPSPDIRWLRDGRPIDTQLHPNIRLLADSRQLRIDSAAVADAAVYRCLATNKAGQDQLDYHLAVHSQYTRPLDHCDCSTD